MNDDQPEPLPLLELTGGLPRVTEDPADLDDLVADFAAGSGPVAIDAERASGYRYSQRAYLVQLARSGPGIALVDPLPWGDVPNDALRPLAEAIAGAEWVIHAASQDLACLDELGMRPRTLFDTELAGRLLNLPRVGLASLVEEYLGLRMRKEHSAVDWSQRPMPDSWLRYAALDVEPLIQLRDILSDLLDRAGKREWARQEFAYWASLPTTPSRTEPWRRTSGIHRVRGRRALAVVRSLWETRDDLARRADIATGRIVPDAAIVEIATTGPSSQQELAQLPLIRRSRRSQYVPTLWHEVQRATALPEAELPTTSPVSDGPPHPRAWLQRNPVAAGRLGRCREVMAVLSETYEVPAENLLSPDLVRRLAWSPPEPATAAAVAEQLRCGAARDWQVGLTAVPLAEALAGPAT